MFDLGAGAGAGLEEPGGGRIPGKSVVLGLSGGVGVSSSKRFIGCPGLRGAGWLTVDPARCEADRSNLAFSWTMANGCEKLVSNRRVVGVEQPES